MNVFRKREKEFATAKIDAHFIWRRKKMKTLVVLQ